MTRKLTLAVLLLAACSSDEESNAAPLEPIAPLFVEVTATAGLSLACDPPAAPTESQLITGGAAAADYDQDGFDDLCVVCGRTLHLFRNRGGGSFDDVTTVAGIDLGPGDFCGPAWADLDGDGFVDLVVGGVLDTKATVWQNRGNGTFQQRRNTGLELDTCFSFAFADFDLDGDLDIGIGRWGRILTAGQAAGHLWRNDGSFRFTDVSEQSSPLVDLRDNTFTPNFIDVDGDGHVDLLFACDFGDSRVMRNDGAGNFVDQTTTVISDENGMGAAIGDYDNDGDLDWFVSSIFDPNGTAEGNWGITGNRLYRNNGDGTFADATDAASVRHASWGWGSSFADFDLDGWLDLVVVNGFGPDANGLLDEYVADHTCLFLGNGDGTFTELSAQLGLQDNGQGRAVVCFDYDRDGDIDLFIGNNGGPGRLFENIGIDNNWLTVKLQAPAANHAGVGATIRVQVGTTTQVRQLRCGCNFASQSPVQAHFGLGAADVVDRIEVVWPDGTIDTHHDVTANRAIELSPL